MIGSKGRFISAIIPLIANFFFTRKDKGEYLDSPSKGSIFAQGGGHSHWGSSAMNYNEISAARRKNRRAKTFKSYGSKSRRSHEKVYR
jgi:hypothetical protein